MNLGSYDQHRQSSFSDCEKKKNQGTQQRKDRRHREPIIWKDKLSRPNRLFREFLHARTQTCTESCGRVTGDLR